MRVWPGGQLADGDGDGFIGGTGKLIVEEIEAESFADGVADGL